MGTTTLTIEIESISKIEADYRNLEVTLDLNSNQLVDAADNIALSLGDRDIKSLIQSLFDALDKDDQTEILGELFGDDEFDNYPDYHHSAMGCGLEDRNITDRYEAMEHGWDNALDKSKAAFDDWLAEKLGR